MKIGNWVGPLLVSAAENGIERLLVIGYHGKLIKLAGGIFHTHHHLADSRLEILAAFAVKQGISLNTIQHLLKTETLESAYLYMAKENEEIAQKLWNYLANEVENRSFAYIQRYGSWPIKVGAALFDRQRRIRWVGSIGHQHLVSYGVSL